VGNSYILIIYAVAIALIAFFVVRAVRRRDARRAHARLNQSQFGTCGWCGSPVIMGDIHCTTCGRQIADHAEPPPPWSDALVASSHRMVQQETAPTAVCGACGAALPSGLKFCVSCGAAVSLPARVCQGCGKNLLDRATFCGHCGTVAEGSSAAC
jgi:predicted amidophosphoribosyltransferase